MLEMVKSDKMQTTTEIESQYPGCKYILTDVGGDHVTVMGKLYCLSDSSDSWGGGKLIEMSKEVELGGKECSIFGSYRNGFAYKLQKLYKHRFILRGIDHDYRKEVPGLPDPGIDN